MRIGEQDFPAKPYSRKVSPALAERSRHEVEAATGFEWPEGRYETLGGLVTAQLERLPEVGDSVVIQGWSLEVTEVEGFRVDRVRIMPPKEPA